MINADARAQSSGIVRALRSAGGSSCRRGAGRERELHARRRHGPRRARLGRPGTSITGHDTRSTAAVGGAYTRRRRTASSPSGRTWTARSGRRRGSGRGLRRRRQRRSRRSTSARATCRATELAVADGVTLSLRPRRALGDARRPLRPATWSPTPTRPTCSSALGLNALFTGSDAADIAVRDDMRVATRLLAASASGASGDAGTCCACSRSTPRASRAWASDRSARSAATSSSGVGFEVSSRRQRARVEQRLLDSLERAATQISGVNVDEELVDMIEQRAGLRRRRAVHPRRQPARRRAHDPHLQHHEHPPQHASIFAPRSSAASSHDLSALVRAQEQVASGKRILRPSDDPVGAALALLAARARLDSVERYRGVDASGPHAARRGAARLQDGERAPDRGARARSSKG